MYMYAARNPTIETAYGASQGDPNCEVILNLILKYTQHNSTVVLSIGKSGHITEVFVSGFILREFRNTLDEDLRLWLR